MQRRSFEEFPCSVAQTLEVIGEWWTPLILRDLFLGVTRFEQFTERLGIARNVLTTRLAHLVDHGVVEKVAYQQHPPRYDYRLTEKGKDLWLVMNALREWGDRHAAPAGPPVQLRHQTCGQVTTIVPTCSCCGEELQRNQVRAEPGPGAQASMKTGMPSGN